MQFTSFQFLVFFPIVTAIFFLAPTRLKKWVLLGASVFFYFSSPFSYVLPIVTITGASFYFGILIERAETDRSRKARLIWGLCTTLGSLFFYKFHDHAVGLIGAFSDWGLVDPGPSSNELPVGISFYTFQAVAYLIDVYRHRQSAEKNLRDFSLSIVFFTKLVAGPIERGRGLLSQLRDASMRFDADRVASGLRLITWGFFKKLVVADRLGEFVNTVYASPADYHGWPLIIAIYLYSFQIYADFSGYTDIAIGSARIFGFDLTENFARPYLSQSIKEFWQRWHISLTSWFRDYVYFPMGGNRVSGFHRHLNILTVFLLSAVWHAATWTFVIWGLLHAVFYFVTMWVNRSTRLNRAIEAFPRLAESVGIFITFNLVSFAWIFFRADNISHATAVIRNASVIGDFARMDPIWTDLPTSVFFILVLMIFEIIQEKQALATVLTWRIRWFAYYLLIMAILLCSGTGSAPFMYGKF
jgi:alginate O-acetyltransferase complex protein AlgI